MKQRKCNTFGCEGIMRPTRRMWDYDSKISNPTYRIYKCCICGKENPWLAEPYSGFHMLSFNEASALSLLSDPDFYPPKPPMNRRRR